MKFLKSNKGWFWLSVLIVIVIVFVGGFTATKLYYLTKYALDDNIKTDSYSNFIKEIRNKEVKTISINNDKSSSFISYNNITIYGDFTNFDESVIPITSGKRYDLFNNGVLSKYIIFGVTNDDYPSYLNLIKSELSFTGNNSNYSYLSDKDDINKYLDNENIENELDLFEYLSNTYDKKFGIFTKTNTMKYVYALHDASKNCLPSIEDLIVINGDYQGFILKEQNNKYEIYLYNNYFIEAFGFTDEEIYQIIANTMIAINNYSD